MSPLQEHKRRVVIAIAVFVCALVMGCGGDPVAVPYTPPSFCESDLFHRYDPLSANEMEMFPDDFHTLDGDSPTGLQVNITPENNPWINDVHELLRSSFDGLSGLSGFATNGGILTRYTGPLETFTLTPDESLTSDQIMLFDLGAEPPERVPFEVVFMDEGHDLAVFPLRPLRTGTLHGLVVTNSVLSLEGDCVSPSLVIQELLTGSTTAPELTRLEPRYRTLLSSTGIAPDIISAATLFTTHRDLDMLVEVARDVQDRSYEWLAPPLCEEEGEFLHCEGVFEAYDYRRDGRYIEDSEVDEEDIWVLPVSVWMPLGGEGPFPTILYAHGINDERGSAEYLAEIVVPEGFAVIASDALEHNDHPTHTEDDISMDSLRFLGIDTQSFSLDALALRGNFNQTTVDRLQLLELIRAQPDVDGDGQADLDIDRLAYYGISMGGMLGSSMTALSDDFGAAVFSVAGGGLLTFVTDNEQVAPALPLLMDLMGGEAAFERLLIIAQAVIDAADPATFAPFVVRDRLLGEPIHVLFPVAVKDDTVPPSTARILARGLGLPQVQPVIEPIPLLTLAASGPVRGNMRDGLVTGGHFQYDRVSSDGGPVEANHDNLSLSEESSTQFLHFLQSWLEDGVPEIIDPYSVLETSPLP